MTTLSPSQSGLHSTSNAAGNNHAQNQTTVQQQQQPQQHSGTAAGLLLDGDGILTQLFYFFWRMKVNAVASAGGGSVTTGTYTHHTKPVKSDDPSVQAVMDLCIPSTVILEHNFPKFWFAKSGDFDDDDISANRSSALSSAPLERRTGRDIDSAAVIRAFRVPEGSSAAQVPGAGDIVASYYAEATDEEGRACTRVEFLDGEGVKGLLIRRTRRPDGILQCWVSPSGKSNSVVQVIWSPHVTHVTKRTNRFPLRDTRLPLYDRAVTFEGLAHFSDEVFVAPHVKTQTQLVCDELVRHFRDVHRVIISRMVLYFKTDTAGRLWFLFGNSLRTADRRQISLSLRGMKPQERIDSENAQSSRMARILIDEAYEVKAAHQAHSKMEEYANAHKRIRQAAKEEPVIRALIGGQPPPYVNLRPKPPTLGPIGDTYCPAPRKPKEDKNKNNNNNNDNNKENENEGEGGSQEQNNNNNENIGENDQGLTMIASSPLNTTTAKSGKSQAAVSLSRLVSKIKSAAALAVASSSSFSSSPHHHLQNQPNSPSSGENNNNNNASNNVMLTSSLACVIPPLFGLVGTIGGGSFSMFSPSSPAQLANNNNNNRIPYSPFRTTNPSASSLSSFITSPQQKLQQQQQQNNMDTPSKSLSGSFLANVNNNNNTTSNSNKKQTGRSGATLWQIARLAVFTGAVKKCVIRPELREFVKGMMYGLYSHFANENATTKMIANTRKGAALKQQARPFRILIPQVYFNALGKDEWWNDLGFSRTRAVKVSEAHLLLPPPPLSAKQQQKLLTMAASVKKSNKKKDAEKSISNENSSKRQNLDNKNNQPTTNTALFTPNDPALHTNSSNNEDHGRRSQTPSDIVYAAAKQIQQDHQHQRASSVTPSADTLTDNQGITSSSSASNNKQHMLASDFSVNLSAIAAAGGAVKARSSSPDQRKIDGGNKNDEAEENDEEKQQQDEEEKDNDDDEEEEENDGNTEEVDEDEDEDDDEPAVNRPVLYSGYKKQQQQQPPQQSEVVDVSVAATGVVTSPQEGSASSKTSSPAGPGSLTGSKIFRKSDRPAPIQIELTNNNNNNNDNASSIIKSTMNNSTSVKNSTDQTGKMIRLNEIPINSHPDDIVLEVASLSAPLLHVQAQMEKLMRTRIDLPAAKTRFFYAGHRVIMDRRKARSFAHVVKQTWVQHKGKEFK